MGDLAGNKLDATQRRFVIEQNATAGVELVALAVIDGGPVAKAAGIQPRTEYGGRDRSLVDRN